MAIQIRRGTNTEWESNNSNIVVGEPAIATDAERFFVGTASGDYAEFANLDIIAPAYDTSTSYVVGDVVNRQGKLYSCNTPCSGAFNVSYWDEKSLAEILKDLENEIDYAQYEIGYSDGKLITIDNGASEIPVKDLTVDIDAVQDLHGYDHPWIGGAGKNKFNYDDVTALSGLSNNNGVFVNTATDTRTSFSPAVQLLNGSTIMATRTMSGAVGRNSATFTIADTITTLRIKHNGASRDLRAEYPFTQTGTFTISMTVTANNPSVIGGLSFKDVQVESGSTATAYEPYSNICPISGWGEVKVNVAGKNLVTNIKTAFVSPSSTHAEYTEGINGTVLVFNCVAGQSYTISGINGNRLIYAVFDSMPSSGEHSSYFENLSSGITFPKTITPQKTGVCVVAVANTQIDTSTAQIELGTTATTYEPYNGNTYTIDLNGTRYGGSLDVTTGVLTLTHGFKTFNGASTESWNEYSSYNGFFITISNMAIGTRQDGLCNWLINNPIDSRMGFWLGVNSRYFFAINVANLLNEYSVSAWKTYLASNPLEIMYPLATPQVVQLTPTQVRTVLGTNNLWNQMNSNNELAYRISNALN